MDRTILREGVEAAGLLFTLGNVACLQVFSAERRFFEGRVTRRLLSIGD